VSENKKQNSTIALHKKALYEYQIEERFEAGLVLEGWEVKSLRAGKAQLVDSYVLLKNGEAWLIGTHISPLNTTSTHVKAVPDRTRKLLMKRQELNKLIGYVERQGYTLIPLDLHWYKNRVKVNIALAKGKKQHDKRASERDKDWARDKARLMKVKL
jgi:SsrA-binding protein